MTNEEKQKAIDALKISGPFMAVTQEEFDDYIQTLNKIMDWLEQDTVPFDFELYQAGLMDMPKGTIEVLDKIRAEIEQNAYPIVHGVNNRELGMTLYGILQIIDKYTTENTSNCGSCKHQNEVDGSNCYECVKGIHNNYKADTESDIEKRKEWKPCINYENGCEEWAGCPCVFYEAESEE